MSHLVSIIIPCYNSANTVCETLESVFKQTYKNIEVIIVNDGSTDDLEGVLKPYLDKKDNITYFKQENKGLSGARNSGSKRAKGVYFLFLDADDLIAPDYLEKCVAVLDSQPNTKIVYSNGRMFGAVDRKWKFPKYNFRLLMLQNMIHAASMMRSADFFKAGMYDEQLSSYEDWNLWIGILKDGGDVVLLHELLFFYRKREDKTSLTDFLDKNPNIARQNRQRIYDNYKELYDKEFGSVIDMLDLIGIQEHIIARYDRKKAKWYRRWMRF